MNIVISPWSAKLIKDGIERPNAKNYPYWRQLVALLRKDGHTVYQIGLGGERIIGANGFLFNQKFEDLKKLIINTHTWVSVDNFLPHFVNTECMQKPGFVVFGLSDPRIYGYSYNRNLLKSEEYLRPDQANMWFDIAPQDDAYFDYLEIRKIIYEKLENIQ